MSPELGRVLLVVGLVLVVIGGLAALGIRLPFGRLPGDIAIEGERGGLHPDRDDARRQHRPDRPVQPLPALSPGLQKSAASDRCGE
jgi:hypothetical protein